MANERSRSPMEGLIRELLTGEINHHEEDYKRKYTMIDDLVNYVLGDSELQRMYQNTDTFASGFTPNIGRLVAKLLSHCRENETFQEEMRKTEAECRDVPEDRSEHTYVSDVASEYVRLMEGEGSIFLFAFLAIICELCSRYTRNAECVASIKNVAKASLFVHWENTFKYEEMDAFAGNNLDNTDESFSKHFSTVVDFLYSEDYQNL